MLTLDWGSMAPKIFLLPILFQKYASVFILSPITYNQFCGCTPFMPPIFNINRKSQPNTKYIQHPLYKKHLYTCRFIASALCKNFKHSLCVKDFVRMNSLPADLGWEVYIHIHTYEFRDWEVFREVSWPYPLVFWLWEETCTGISKLNVLCMLRCFSTSHS